MRPQFSRVVAVVGIVAGSFLASLRPAMAQEGGGGHFDPPGPPPIVVVVRLDDVTFNANYDDGANAEAEVLLVVGVHHHGHGEALWDIEAHLNLSHTTWWAVAQNIYVHQECTPRNEVEIGMRLVELDSDTKDVVIAALGAAGRIALVASVTGNPVPLAVAVVTSLVSVAAVALNGTDDLGAGAGVVPANGELRLRLSGADGGATVRIEGHTLPIADEGQCRAPEPPPPPPPPAERGSRMYEPLREAVRNTALVQAEPGNPGELTTEQVEDIRESLVSLMLGLGALVAGAEVEAARGFESAEEAIVLYEAGQRLAEAGDLTGALSKFEEAYVAAATARETARPGPDTPLPFQLALTPRFFSTKSGGRYQAVAAAFGANGPVNFSLSDLPPGIEASVVPTDSIVPVSMIEVDLAATPPGRYVVQVTAHDGSTSVSSDLQVVVNPGPPCSPPHFVRTDPPERWIDPGRAVDEQGNPEGLTKLTAWLDPQVDVLGAILRVNGEDSGITVRTASLGDGRWELELSDPIPAASWGELFVVASGLLPRHGEDCPGSYPTTRLLRFPFASLTGDINGDGRLSVLDIVEFRSIARLPAGARERARADLDRDGRGATVSDLVVFRQTLHAAPGQSLPPEPSAQPGAVAGKAWVSESNGVELERPNELMGLEVILVRDGEVLAATTTDERGYYAFPVFEDGAYEVQAIAPDSREALAGVEVSQGAVSLVHWAFLPHTEEGIFPSYAAVAPEPEKTPSPDLDDDGRVGLLDLELLQASLGEDPASFTGDLTGDGAIDEEDVERLKGVFGRVIVHVGSQYAAQVSPGGSVARIGEGLAVVSSLEGHTAGVLHPGPTASVVRFEVTEDRGTAVWEGPEFSFVFPFGENAENPSWIEVDLHSGRVLGGNLTVRLTIDLFDHRVVEVAAPIQDGFVVLRPHGFELYHLTGIRGTLPEDFPLFGGQAFLLGKCDIPKAVSGHCCTVDYGVREEAGEMWAYIELSSGTELIAAPFDPADTEDYSRVRLFGLTTAQMAAREGMDNSEYIGLLRSDPVSRASKLWETGFPKFRGTAGQDAILNRLSQHLTFFVGKAQQFLAPPWVGDGCTGVPDFNFEDCCDAHDACYCRGGTEFDRLDCDLALYACIATTPPPWSAPLRNIKLAGVYFSGVRAFGSGHFNY